MVSDDTKQIMQTYFQSQNEVIYWNKAANDKTDDISKYLLTGATIAIPLIGTIAFNIHHITYIQALLLSISLILLILSIYFGIENLESANEFFLKYQKHNIKRADALYMNQFMQYERAIDVANNASDPYVLPPKSDETFAKCQKWTVIIGLTLSALVIMNSMINYTNLH